MYSAAKAWASYRATSEQVLANFIGSSLSGRRRQVTVNGVAVAVTNFGNNNGSMRLYFYAYFIGSTIPPSEVSAAVIGGCAGNQDPSLVGLCGPIHAPQASNAFAVGGTNFIIVIVIAACVLIVLVVTVVSYNRRRRFDRRQLQNAIMPSQAVSVEKPNFSKEGNSSEFYHEDDVLDATTMAQLDTTARCPY